MQSKLLHVAFVVCLLWHARGSSDSCTLKDDVDDDVASMSLLQSHMNLGSLPTTHMEPHKRSLQDDPEHKNRTAVSFPGEFKVPDLSTADRPKSTRLVNKDVHPDPGMSTAETAKALLVNPRTYIVVGILLASCFFVGCLLQIYAPSILVPFACAVTYVFFSSSLIFLNKIVMQDEVFPYAVALTMLHMTSTWIGLVILYQLSPNLFPQMHLARPGTEVLGVAYDLRQYFVPLGCFFAVSLFGANAAYHYCEVSFLQFMKQSGLVWLMIVSAAAGLQKFTTANILSVVLILIGSSMTISGEIHFVLLGFVFQLLSQTAETCRQVGGEWMMTASKAKLDALTFTLSLAPMTMIPLSIGTIYTYEHAMRVAFWGNFYLLIVDAVFAVGLNVVTSMVIRHCTAIGYTLLAMVKDIVIVLVSAAVFGDTITIQQYIGFSICITGILAYSSTKHKPEWWAWLSPSCEKPLPSCEEKLPSCGQQSSCEAPSEATTREPPEK